jgi:hypothetical protein
VIASLGVAACQRGTDRKEEAIIFKLSTPFKTKWSLFYTPA